MLARPLMVASLMCALGAPAGPVLAQQDEPIDEGPAFTVVPPGGDPLGLSYGEWAAAWERWMLGTPLAENPGEVDDCQADQDGEVFYLGLAIPGVTLETDCVVTSDQYLFAPAAVTTWQAQDGDTADSMRAGIEAELDADPPIVTDASVSVDGVVVPDLDRYQVISPLFDVTYIEDNIAGAEPGTGQEMVGGWFVMLEPLPPGSHVIELSADIDVPDDDLGPLTARTVANVEVTEATSATLSLADAAAAYELGSGRYNDRVRALEKKTFSTLAQGRKLAGSHLANQEAFTEFLREQAWPSEVQPAIDVLIERSLIQAKSQRELTRARTVAQFQGRAAAVRKKAEGFNDAAIAAREALGLGLSERLEEVTTE